MEYGNIYLTKKYLIKKKWKNININNKKRQFEQLVNFMKKDSPNKLQKNYCQSQLIYGEEYLYY